MIRPVLPGVRMTETRQASTDVETPTRTPSMTVVAAVADARGVDPLELEPLANAIDPEALDRLFADTYDGHSRTAGYLTFEVAGCDVTVTGDGEVSVTQRAVTEERWNEAVTDR